MKEKIVRFNVKKTMKTKYTQTEFGFTEAVMHSQNPEPKYTPPKPSEMTVKELEDWFIFGKPTKCIKNEIMARMNKGVEFPRIRMVQYLGRNPILIPVFHD